MKVSLSLMTSSSKIRRILCVNVSMCVRACVRVCVYMCQRRPYVYWYIYHPHHVRRLHKTTTTTTTTTTTQDGTRKGEGGGEEDPPCACVGAAIPTVLLRNSPINRGHQSYAHPGHMPAWFFNLRELLMIIVYPLERTHAPGRCPRGMER